MQSRLHTIATQLASDLTGSRYQHGQVTERLSVNRYFDGEWLSNEKHTLFRSLPLAIAHSSEVTEPGTVVKHEAPGSSLLLVRDGSGTLTGFFNVCSHRGMRLVDEDRCRKSTLSCPFHGWTYGLDGCLRHVPRAEAFDDVNLNAMGLVRFPVAEAGGIVWGIADSKASIDMDASLGDLVEDLEHLEIPRSLVYRRSQSIHACNWKFIIEAFLESYHFKVLHRDTIYPFHLDSTAAFEERGAHVRIATARRPLTEVQQVPTSAPELRQLCTYVHLFFPNTILIHHPDYTSMLTVYPEAVDRSRWIHTMLIPVSKSTPDWKPHWEKTWNLIETAVFQREDLRAAEGMHAGLSDGSKDTVTFGKLEYQLATFHRNIERHLEADAVSALPSRTRLRTEGRR